MLVALPLVPRGAGRRQQHDRGAFRLTLYQRMSGVERRLQVAAAVERHLALELASEQLGRLADQEGMADAVEPGREWRHAALLRLAAQDPVDVAIARQSARRGVGVGGLAVVDVDDAAHRSDALLAVRQAGIGFEASDDLVAR